MAQPSKTASRRPPWVRALARTLSGVLVLAALVLGWFVYRLYYANPRTDDAYVHADTAAVAAHVSGQILQLPIKDNQRVKRGDLLFVVDPRPYKLALDTARTKLHLTEIEIKTLQDTIRAAEAQLAQRKVDVANVKQYLDRIVPLRERDFVTDNDVVEARTSLKPRTRAWRPRLLTWKMRRMRWEFWAMSTSESVRLRKQLMTLSLTMTTASFVRHSTAL